MTQITTNTRSLRRARFQARIPRAIALLFVLVLSVAGVRSIIAPRHTTVISRAASSGPALDQGAEDFAVEFTRAYLTFDSANTQQREHALQPFLPSTLGQDAGLQTGTGNQSVSWTSVAGEQADGSQTLVTVAAQTSNGLFYLNVPVSRDGHGFMYVSGYPAFVGPPASDTSASLPSQGQITDPSLQTVVARAVTNFLAGNQQNLLADLTPNALVSLPPVHMTVTATQQATWVVTGHQVAIQVTANDSHGNSWTLTYDVTVEKLDRWYVQSIQVNPTFTGGTS